MLHKNNSGAFCTERNRANNIPPPNPRASPVAGGSSRAGLSAIAYWPFRGPRFVTRRAEWDSSLPPDSGVPKPTGAPSGARMGTEETIRAPLREAAAHGGRIFNAADLGIGVGAVGRGGHANRNVPRVSGATSGNSLTRALFIPPAATKISMFSNAGRPLIQMLSMR